MRRRHVLLGVSILLVLGASGGLLVRGILRWRTLEALASTESFEAWRVGDPSVEHVTEETSEQMTSFGVFAVALPEHDDLSHDVTDDARVLIRAESSGGRVVMFSFGIVDEEPFRELADRTRSLCLPIAWDDGSSVSAATSTQAQVQWIVENYRPARFGEVLWFGSVRFEQEVLARAGWAVSARSAQSPAVFSVTDNAVFFHYSTGRLGVERLVLEVYSRRSMLRGVIGITSTSSEWMDSAAARIIATFRDTSMPGMSDDDIKRSLVRAVGDELDP